jgi:hypothetical protein
VSIALRPADGETIEDLAARASTVGFDLGPIMDMHRVRPDGTTLRWRMTMPEIERRPGVPFLIDWGGTPQPSDTILAQAELTGLRIEVPEPERIRALHDVLDSTVPLVRSRGQRLVVEISGPDGTSTADGPPHWERALA